MADHFAHDDEHALSIARTCIRNLNWKKNPSVTITEPEAPRYPAEELYGVVGTNLQVEIDPREIIARLVDGEWARRATRCIHFSPTMDVC